MSTLPKPEPSSGWSAARFSPEILLARACGYHVPALPPGKSCQMFHGEALPRTAVVDVQVSGSQPALTVMTTSLARAFSHSPATYL